jgi:hypothetical protein
VATHPGAWLVHIKSLPVFGLAHLLGFELLPCIRNWQDLVFYRPDRADRYEHIDALFSAEAVDWQLIETHWDDLMRVALSVRAGRISSVTLLRRLGNESKKNRIYRALREVGRVVRTIVLLRYLSEPELRDSIAAITNRVEAFHGFADWLSFGREAGRTWPRSPRTSAARSAGSGTGYSTSPAAGGHPRHPRRHPGGGHPCESVTCVSGSGARCAASATYSGRLSDALFGEVPGWAWRDWSHAGNGST